jgi:hypothetical protein
LRVRETFSMPISSAVSSSSEIGLVFSSVRFMRVGAVAGAVAGVVAGVVIGA